MAGRSTTQVVKLGGSSREWSPCTPHSWSLLVERVSVPGGSCPARRLVSVRGESTLVLASSALGILPPCVRGVQHLPAGSTLLRELTPTQWDQARLSSASGERTGVRGNPLCGSLHVCTVRPRHAHDSFELKSVAKGHLFLSDFLVVKKLCSCMCVCCVHTAVHGGQERVSDPRSSRQL